MSEITFRKNMIALFIVSLITSVVIGLIIGKLVSYENYKNMSSFINNVLLEKPELEKEIMFVLKASLDNPHDNSLDILQNYGYTSQVFLKFSLSKVVLISSFLVFLLFFVFIINMYIQHNKSLSRIQSLSNYLYKINTTGEAEVLIQVEDKFSVLEDEVYKTVMELKTTKEIALSERNSLADNLADIAHQLKTPITAISLMVQLLSKENKDDKVYIEKVEAQIDRIEYLVSTLLKLSRLDAGTIVFEEKKIDVYSMLSLMVEQIESIAIQKNQNINVEENLSISVIGDENWIIEAITNILKNCCEHTPNNGEINISYSDNPLYVEIIISDNGTGFAKDDLQNLFKRFYKGENANKNSIGIGLALTKSIIEKQNGIIKADNNSLGGSKFIIKFYR